MFADSLPADRPQIYGRLTLALLLVLPACKAVPTGDNLQHTTSGVADDGDDSNGPRTVYSNPARRGADNATVATSDPQSFRQLAGDVTAQPGANATRLATASATNKAESSFTVTRAAVCAWTLTTTISATINSGRGEVQVVARVLDGQGRPVQGSDFQVFYTLTENNADPMSIDVTKGGQLDGSLPDGGVYQDGDVESPFFPVPPETYTMLFEVNVLGSADTQARVRAISAADLQ